MKEVAASIVMKFTNSSYSFHPIPGRVKQVCRGGVHGSIGISDTVRLSSSSLLLLNYIKKLPGGGALGSFEPQPNQYYVKYSNKQTNQYYVKYSNKQTISIFYLRRLAMVAVKNVYFYIFFLFNK